MRKQLRDSKNIAPTAECATNALGMPCVPKDLTFLIKMSSAELAEIYEDLNFPSANVFYKALRKRGIAVRQKDVEEFVKSRSERQVIAPGPKYEGNVVAWEVNDRWAADNIAFTSRPAKGKDGTFTHVLLVQDLFSRYLYARPLKSVSETTQAFSDIIEESRGRDLNREAVPRRLDTDGGPEFANKTFEALMARLNIEHVIKDSKDYQALAITDRAIGIVKRGLARREEAKGGSWLSNLEAVIKSYNSSEQGGIEDEPANIDDDTVFTLRKEAAEELAENTELIEKRQKKLEEAGAYRVHQPKKGGLRQRIDANTWSREVRTVQGFPGPGMVEDSEGNRTLTKFAKPVPRDSSALVEKPPTRPPDNLERFAKALANKLSARGSSFSQASKLAKAEPGFTDALRASTLSFAQFAARFPKFLKIRDDRLYPARVATLA